MVSVPTVNIVPFRYVRMKTVQLKPDYYLTHDYTLQDERKHHEPTDEYVIIMLRGTQKQPSLSKKKNSKALSS